jgi:GNAT superfamily N-acetyltransferase
METRRAQPTDAPLLAAHRKSMFLAMGLPTAKLDPMACDFENWVAAKLAAQSFFAWIVFDGERPVASVGLLLTDWPPVPFAPGCTLRAYIQSLFVEADCRRQGLGASLVRLCLDEAHRRGVPTVALHASESGRHLYETLGFAATNEMSRGSSAYCTE